MPLLPSFVHRLAGHRLVAPSLVLALVTASSGAVSGCKISTGASRGKAVPVGSAARVPAAPAVTQEPRADAPREQVVVDPQGLEGLRASSALPALDLAEVAIPAGLTTIALLDTARTEARGLVGVGGIRAVHLQEGQRAAAPLILAVGDCLTVIAHGGLGVREVDVFVVEGAAPEGAVLGQDGVGGPLAIVGGQAGCLRSDVARPVEVVVVARKGAGPVLAAIFQAPPSPR